MNTITRLALYGFIAGLSAILLTYSHANVVSADEGQCDNGAADDCSDWGDATRDFAPLGDHASNQENPRVGVGNLDLDEGDGDIDDDDGDKDHPSETACILDSSVC